MRSPWARKKNVATMASTAETRNPATPTPAPSAPWAMPDWFSCSQVVAWPTRSSTWASVRGVAAMARSRSWASWAPNTSTISPMPPANWVPAIHSAPTTTANAMSTVSRAPSERGSFSLWLSSTCNGMSRPVNSTDSATGTRIAPRR